MVPSDIEAEMTAEDRARAIRCLCEVEGAPDGLAEHYIARGISLGEIVRELTGLNARRKGVHAELTMASIPAAFVELFAFVARRGAQGGPSPAA
jgi:hypothetical protein